MVEIHITDDDNQGKCMDKRQIAGNSVRTDTGTVGAALWKLLLWVSSWSRSHPCIVSTIVVTTALVVLVLIPLTPTNVSYSANFDSAAAGARVTFMFDKDGRIPEKATQNSFVQTGAATIALDPLNQNSSTLAIVVNDSNATLRSLDVSVRVNNHVWYTFVSIPGGEVESKRTPSEGNTTFTVSADRMASIRRIAKARSEYKILIAALILIAYVVALLRFSVLKKLNIRVFIAGVAVGLLLCGFMANLWLVKQPFSRNTSFAFNSTSSLNIKGKYIIEQKLLVQGKHAGFVKLPISLAYNVGPTDPESGSNPSYDKLYASANEFKDRYLLNITAEKNQSVVFDGIITPSMMDETRSNVVIPMNLNGYNGTILSVKLSKTSEGTPSLLFTKGTLQGQDPTLLKPSVQRLDAPAWSANDYLNLSVGYNGIPYQVIITMIVIAGVLLLIVNLLFGGSRFIQIRSWVSGFDYIAMMLYAAAQAFIYMSSVQGFPDEAAHVSYVEALATGSAGRGVVPQFANMRIYALTDVDIDLTKDAGFNYLGHPPLYYRIMMLLTPFNLNGNIVTFSLQRMRLMSFLIGIAGIALIYYIGFTRIRKFPVMHLLFAMIVIAPVNMVYGISGVTNDSLTILTVAVFLLGIIRFYERRYGLTTYVLIAVGISATVLTKLTAGMIVVVIACLVIVYTCVAEKRGKEALRRPSFYASWLIYVIPIGYFIALYMKYHTIQPGFQNLALREYIDSPMYTTIDARTHMGVWESVMQLLKSFVSTWHMLTGHVYVYKPDYPWYSLDRVAVIMILIVPFVVFAMKRSRLIDYMRIGISSVCIVFLYQARSVFSSYYINGRFGGYSSRYYLCAIGIFALIAIWLIVQRFGVNDKNVVESASDEIRQKKTHAGENCRASGSVLTQTGILVCSVLFLLLLFDGFVYSVLYYADNTPAFIG